jgi:hypothetical protein
MAKLMARGSTDHSGRQQDVVEQIVRVLRALDCSISDVQAIWASELKLSVPQWNILVTIAGADDDVGISVKSVAEALRVNPSFIVHQSRAAGSPWIHSKDRFEQRQEGRLSFNHAKGAKRA